ncbi:hypothetical protein SAMN06265339_1416 [Desulfurobacterium pacificum]|uniref:SMP-30/Gluconolactonase/LRE-like region domain-containing protein n=1 Tax=Desulfurobacterium pacificum TaxID=240166 RepID=A0ABY1NQR9_9BACT|nr:ATP/GTP-binding protein [Desulfurobacterium pacificum]SMP15756.1 hypothetical protein SAMN06265339_1416 [Desulfurobacterium pacificum]
MGIITAAAGALTLTLILLNSLSGGLKTPESSQCYRGKLYISNIGNLPPDSKDGDGYITLASLDGKIIKTKFTKGLNAPKGITFAKGKLFVADIDTVVVIDPQSGKILRKIPAPGARFLNDTAFNGKYVYVSDTLTNTIYQVDPSNYSVKVFLQNNELEGPNGIAFTPNGTMIVVSYGSGKVFQINRDKSLKVLTQVSGFLDGVVVLNDGTILFSSFSGGKIYAFKNGKIKILKSGLITPADIGYCDGKLFVPEFSANKVEIFKVK